MPGSQMRLLAKDLILSASGVLQRLHGLIDLFITTSSPVPAELCHLREAILALRELLDSFCAAEEFFLQTVKQERAALGFRNELILARKLLTQLNENLQAIQQRQTLGPQELRSDENASASRTSLKATWSLHRAQAVQLHKEFRDICSRCLGEMLLMNASISTNGVEPMLELGRKSDGDWTTSSPHVGINTEDKMLREERSKLIQQAQSVDAPKFYVQGENLKTLRHDVEPKAPPRTPRNNFRVQSTDVRRDADDAELILSGIAASVTSSSLISESTFSTIAASVTSSSSFIERTPRYRPRHAVGGRELQIDNERLCTCRCHSSGLKNPLTWAISTFKFALGVVSLDFRGRSDAACSECSNTCRTRQTGSAMRLVYSFPTWLFHAAISASFTNTTGSPELVLRVLHRIPNDSKSIFTSVFGIIARGDGDGLKRALRTREISVFDINGNNGTGVLWTCVAMNRLDFIQILLYEGADLFQIDDKGVAPYPFLLHTLFTSPRIDDSTRTRLEAALPMEEMLEACQLNELHKIAVGLRHTSVQEYMRLAPQSQEANSFDIRFRTPLAFASARGNLAAVRQLLEVGARPDLEVPTRAKPKGPLASACTNGHLAVVEELLRAGADVNAVNGTQTPLHHLAPSSNALSIAACLIQHGANIHAVDSFLSTPLDLASHHNNAALVDYLLRNGADPNHRDWEGSNALQIAISSNAYATVSVLLEHNADYRNVDEYKRGVLHYLGYIGSVPMMEIMARHRMVHLDVNALDSQNQTPMQLCRARSDSTEALQEAFELLLASIVQDSAQHASITE